MKRRVAAIITCLLLGCSLPGYAQINSEQAYSFLFRGISLQQALEEVAAETEIDMVYDPELVRGITVFDHIRHQPVPDLLRSLLADTQLDFVILSSGTVVIVEKVNEAPGYGSFAGKVIDRRTGEPLSGATVLLADASGGTSTSASGRFVLNRLVSGTYKIIFSYVGYKPVEKTITIEPQQNLRQKISLKPDPVDFTPIVVKGHSPELSYSTHKQQSIDPNTPWQTTGRMHDAVRSLALFPGIKYGLPMSDLHVQGGQTGDHRILLDGVPMYNPYSFGQMFSAFSPYAINRIELHKAGYEVDEGSQIAGLIDMRHDISNNGNNQVVAQSDPLSVNLRGNLSLPIKDKTETPRLHVMGASRINYWGLFKDPVLDHTLGRWNSLDPLVTNVMISPEVDASRYQPREQHADVHFHDLHLASRYEINDYQSLSSSFYVGENFVSTDLLNQGPQVEQSPKYLYSRDQYRWNNFMGQLTYSQLLSARLNFSSQLSYSSSKLRHRYEIGTSNIAEISISENDDIYAFDEFQEASSQNLLPTQNNINHIQHLIFRTDATYSFTPQLNVDVGTQLDYVNSRVDFSDLFYLPTLSNQQSVLFSSYLNGHWRVGDYWTFTAGNRITYADVVDQLYSEPRLSVQYDQAESAIGFWSARIAGGLYRQFINQYEITNPGPTSLVPSFTFWSHASLSKIPKAWHLSGSFHLEPGKSTSVNVEGFYKWQPTTYTVSYNNLLQGTTVSRSDVSAFAERTNMRVLGAGIRFKQAFAEERLKFMAGYDYSYSRIDLDTQFGRKLPPHWNEPHQFQLRSLWHITPLFTAVAKWQSIWGRTWGFRQSYYNFLTYESNRNYGNFDFKAPEKNRMSPIHQLDVSFIYKPQFAFMDLQIRADINNLLDHQNVIDWGLRKRESANNSYEIKKRKMPGFNPSISIEINF